MDGCGLLVRPFVFFINSCATMTDGPLTRETLLLRIRDRGNADAWKQFVDVYAPLIQMYACRKGLQASDAADVTQEVMQKIATMIHRFDYDRCRGQFRGWLHTLTRNQVINFRKRHHKLRGSGDTSVQQLLEAQPTNDDVKEWETVYQRQVMSYAMRQVRAEFTDLHWQAFEMTAIEHIRPADVSTRIGMSVGAIYVAKSRVVARLREFARDLGDDWEGGV